MLSKIMAKKKKKDNTVYVNSAREMRKMAVWEDRGERHFYHCPMVVGNKLLPSITTVLAIIQKNDDGWQWTIRVDRNAKYWSHNYDTTQRRTEGTIKSLEEAKKIVESYWGK